MHLYSALLCIVVHPKRFTIMWGGLSSTTALQHPLEWCDAATGQRHQCAHHTPATGKEERESHRVNQVYALTTHQLQVERRESHRANQVYALTTHQLQVERRESHRANQVYALTTHQVQVERRESHRANQVYALTTHQLQVERRESHRANQVYALTTHQLQVERSVLELIKWMGIIRRPWSLTRARGGNLARTSGLHPYSLQEVP